jgi:Membrane-anchored protein predicted to be involved in regulation of amylopullulanase
VNAKIAQGSAWQWVIQAAGWPSNSYVESCSGQTYTTPLIVKGDLATKTVSIEVPTSLIGSNITGYSYVIIAGFQDGYATNGWDPVYPNATDYQGGGAKTPYAPNIFSYIAPNLVNSSSPLTQQAVLSNYTNTSYATLYAVKLPLLRASTQSTTMPQAKPSLSIIGYDNSTGSLNAFYLMGNKVYWSTSSNGEIWSQPKPIINATGTVVSLSYDPAANALLVAYSNGLTMVKYRR